MKCEVCNKSFIYSPVVNGSIAQCNCGKLFLEGEAAELLPTWDRKENKTEVKKDSKDSIHGLSSADLFLVLLYTTTSGCLPCPLCSHPPEYGSHWPYCGNCGFCKKEAAVYRWAASSVFSSARQMINCFIWNINALTSKLGEDPEDIRLKLVMMATDIENKKLSSITPEGSICKFEEILTDLLVKVK